MVQDIDKCRSMPGVCAWKRPDLMAIVAASTSKPVGSWIGCTRDSLAVGAVSGHVVGLASGRSLYPSWATPAFRSRGSPRQEHLSAGTTLALRHSASSAQSSLLEVVLAFPEDEDWLALCLTLLTHWLFGGCQRSLDKSIWEREDEDWRA
jgi:hypothetical protein